MLHGAAHQFGVDVQVKVVAGVYLVGLGGEHLAAGDGPFLAFLAHQFAVFDAALAEVLGQDQVRVQKAVFVDQIGPNTAVLGARRLGGLVADGGFGLGDREGAGLGGVGGWRGAQGRSAA